MEKCTETVVRCKESDDDEYKTNVIAFLKQCLNDTILLDAKVIWGGECEFDFYGIQLIWTADSPSGQMK